MNAGRTVQKFWRPSRDRRPTSTPGPQNRHKGVITSAVYRRPSQISVNLEVKRFQHYGSLRKTSTNVRNSLPSVETIQVEKHLLNFEQKRRLTPDEVNYSEFYRFLDLYIHPSAFRQGWDQNARLQLVLPNEDNEDAYPFKK